MGARKLTVVGACQRGQAADFFPMVEDVRVDTDGECGALQTRQRAPDGRVAGPTS